MQQKEQSICVSAQCPVCNESFMAEPGDVICDHCCWENIRSDNVDSGRTPEEDRAMLHPQDCDCSQCISAMMFTVLTDTATRNAVQNIGSGEDACPQFCDCPMCMPIDYEQAKAMGMVNCTTALPTFRPVQLSLDAQYNWVGPICIHCNPHKGSIRRAVI